MQAVEIMATIDDRGEVDRDLPVLEHKSERVRVIVYDAIASGFAKKS